MKIAVVGTGITGMAAAWLLDSRHEIVVYEQDHRIGGHSNTVDAPGRHGGESVGVDTGFIVFNDHTYPNLVQLFDHLGVATKPSTMSFAVSAGGGRLEYAGNSLVTLFAQARNLVRPSHYGMIRDILRFNREAPSLVAKPNDPEPTLGEYLTKNGYGRAFVINHLLPMGAAIWSATTDDMMRFPARSFVRFFSNHGLLRLKNRPQWRTVRGGSREYVSRLTADYADKIRRGSAVVSVHRTPVGAIVRDASGHEDRFDQVVLATHGDQALALLGDAAPEERAVLGAFRYNRNRAVLHTDPALMPRRRRVWSSWNYMARGEDGGDATVSVTYWMNRLQGLTTAEPLFVSLNPLAEPDPSRVIAEFDYDHPQFDQAAMAAQRSLPSIQGVRRTWFCGSYCGHGFHEDGLAAGLAAAEALGCPRPWDVAEVSPARYSVLPAGAPVMMAAE